MSRREASPPIPVTLDGSPLTTGEVVAVARGHAPVSLADPARERVAAARAVVAAAADHVDPIYGLNTGFGSLSKVRISVEQVHEIQRNIVGSQGGGGGDPLPADGVRGTLLLLAARLARGHSG
ncbi:MAG: aromatic amino acid lyase, partial [Planctomycetota bacterium]|nr:aromatic amino acid lyase [Planctomycetota bacterium]